MPGQEIEASDSDFESISVWLNTEYALQFTDIGTTDRYRASFISTHKNQPLVMLAFKTLDMVQVDNMAAVNPKKHLRIEFLLYAAE